MGTIIDDPIRTPLPKPQKTAQGGYTANIVVIDVFGNCSTNLRVKMSPDLTKPH